MSTEEDICKAINELEERLSISPGFFDKLAEEDDWSFVIKSHAILEASLTHWLSVELGRPELINTLAILDTSDPRKGKLAFLKELKQLEADDRRFISSLSTLRNNLVHNVSNTSFSFHDYVQSFDKNQKSAFIKAFGYAFIDLDDRGKEIITSPEEVLKEPKKAIWHGLRVLLGIASLTMNTKELVAETHELELAYARKYRELFKLPG